MSDYVGNGPTLAIGSQIGLKSTLSLQNLVSAPIFFLNPEEGPAVVDTNNPAVMITIKRNVVLETIIDRGFGVNVINRRTCDTLGLREWEPYPF